MESSFRTSRPSFKQNENDNVEGVEEKVHGDDENNQIRHHATPSTPEIPSPRQSSPPSGEVILKINQTFPSFAGLTTVPQCYSSSESASQVGRDTPLSNEFSFQTPDQAKNMLGPQYMDRPGSAGGGSGSGDMRLDVGYDAKDIRHQQHSPRPDNSPHSSYKSHAASHTSNNTNNNSVGSTNASNLEGSREIKVSFQESLNSKPIRRCKSIYNTIDDGSSSNSSVGDEEDSGGSKIGRSGLQSRRDNKSSEILKCTSTNTSLRRLPSMAAAKTRSRLADIPSTPTDNRANRKSALLNMKSGVGKSSRFDEEEEDPFQGDDVPDEYKEAQISTLIVLEWVSLVILVGALICSLIIPVLKIKTLWSMKLWKWEALILVLICGRLVSDWGMRIIVFFIERNFLLRKRLLYFVYGLKKAVQNVIWLGLVLLTWHFLFDKKVLNHTKDKPLQVVTKLLVIGEVCTLVWLGKTLLVKFCASTFHVNAFFDRIQDALFNQFVIETLSGPPLFDINSPEQEEYRGVDDIDLHHNVDGTTTGKTFERVDEGLGGTKSAKNVATHKSPVGQSTGYSSPINKKMNDGIPIEQLHRLNQKNVSAWNMKRLVKMVRHGALTTLDETIVDTNTQDDDTNNRIRNENEAKAAARKIFRNVAQPRCRYIYLEDILRFMREDEAVRTMGLFEGTPDSEKISKQALKNWVVAVFKERRALSLTLTDTNTAVNKLHKFMDVIVCIIILVIVATTLDIISSDSIVFLSSQVVVAAFIFGNTCKNVFESIIFVFVVHPFDVGDRCEIDGVQMIVEEMNILTTIFLRYDNLKIVFPNYTLLTLPINNFYRSPDMGDVVEFFVHIATPIEKITQMRQRIISYIDNKKEHWYPNPIIILKDVEKLHMLKIAVWLQHKMNHQEMVERFARRALLLEECVKVFKDLDMEYRVSQGNVNVQTMTSHNIPQVPFSN